MISRPLLPALLALSFLNLISQARAQAPAAWSEQLWAQARGSIQAGHPADAISPLQELLKKYPASPHYTDALQSLGEAHLRSGHPEAATAPLEQARRAWGSAPRGWPAGLLLVEALQANRKHERATLLAVEIQKQTQSKTGQSSGEGRPTFQKALLLEVESRIVLNQDERAQRLLTHAELLRGDLAGDLKARSLWLKLKLHGRGCQAASSVAVAVKSGTDSPKAKKSEGRLWPWLTAKQQPPRALSETGALEQMERISLCARESVPLFLETASTGSAEFRSRSRAEALDILTFWLKRCSLAPLPTQALSPEQLGNYREELAQEQRRRCRTHVKELLGSLAKSEPPPIVIQGPLNSSDLYGEDIRGLVEQLAREELGRLDP